MKEIKTEINYQVLSAGPVAFSSAGSAYICSVFLLDLFGWGFILLIGSMLEHE